MRPRALPKWDKFEEVVAIGMHAYNARAKCHVYKVANFKSS